MQRRRQELVRLREFGSAANASSTWPLRRGVVTEPLNTASFAPQPYLIIRRRVAGMCGTLGATRRGHGRLDGLKDELGRGVGLRHERNVRGRDLDDRRVRAL